MQVVFSDPHLGQTNWQFFSWQTIQAFDRETVYSEPNRSSNILDKKARLHIYNLLRMIFFGFEYQTQIKILAKFKSVLRMAC